MNYFAERIEKLRNKIDHLEIDLKKRKKDYLGKIVMRFKGKTYYISRESYSETDAVGRTLDAAFSVVRNQT